MRVKDRNQKAKLKKWIEHTLNKFKFVSWDRFISFSNISIVRFYGWIEREKDSYKDFIVLDFDYLNKKVFFVASSSLKYTQEITKILQIKQYKICTRVESAFNVLKAIKIKNVK